MIGRSASPSPTPTTPTPTPGIPTTPTIPTFPPDVSVSGRGAIACDIEQCFGPNGPFRSGQNNQELIYDNSKDWCRRIRIPGTVTMEDVVEMQKKLYMLTKTINNMDTKKITVQTVINAPLEKVWNLWTTPEHITKWNNVSNDWHTPRAENDFWVGEKFLYRMEAKDGSFGFDFAGVYDEIIRNELIAYTIDDERKVNVTFRKNNDGETVVVETFEAENTNPLEMQRGGWQSILDNFKKYVESSN